MITEDRKPAAGTGVVEGGRVWGPTAPPLDQRPDPLHTPRTLRGLFRAYRWRILLTYALFNLENLLRLAQPFALGLAINGLLRSSPVGLAVFAALHLGHLAIAMARRVYDTRAFTGMYAELATGLVLAQRGQEVEVSRIAARSALSREFVDFFERSVPAVLRSFYSVVGAVVVLGLYDWLLVPLCLGLLIPSCLLNFVYGRKALRFTGGLNDRLEREVEVISRGRPEEVSGHFRNAARCRVRLSDWEALTAALMELFVLGLVAAALVRFCTAPDATAGSIFAVFRYIVLFIMGLDGVPALVQQAGRLHDIGRRMRHTCAPAGVDGGHVIVSQSDGDSTVPRRCR